ncbi:Di-copper centre-containing protein [Ceratobasidium sp. AG-I]|nr:Di-copper centre-containing protein [Ceratobasidium sp. AG-I]
MRNILAKLLAAAALVPFVAGADAVAAGAGKCSSIEVRKEWRSFSKKEKKAWITAVNCLNRTPRSGKLAPPVNTSNYTPFDQIPPISPLGTYYDELVYAHMNLNPIIHLTGLFLPWHRLYVHEWTNALRSKCGYKGVAPYWAWEQDTPNFENSTIWDSDPDTGLGGFGDPNDDNIVKTGGLKVSFIYPSKHPLRRRYNPHPFAGIPGFPDIDVRTTFTPAEVQALLAQPTGNFTAFQFYMEKFNGMHGAIHGITGGDLAGTCPRGSNSTNCPFDGAPTFSANEPMFHMHHGNVDRLWWLWQEKNLINKFSFRGGAVQNISALDQYPNGSPPWLSKTSPIPGAGMFKSISIASVLDTRSPPLCYVYDK